jgi:CMP-N-acetylneuraminic acid synthetase
MADRILAVVPARADSERLPGKCWRPLGRWAAMVDATLEAAALSNQFDWIELSTNRHDYRPPGTDWAHHTRVHLRDPLLDGPLVSAIDVVRDSLGRHPEATAVAMLLPTSPFRTWQHIRRAVVEWAPRREHVPLVSVQELHSMGRRIRVASPYTRLLLNPIPGRVAEGVVASSGAIQLASRGVFLEQRCGFHWPRPRYFTLDYYAGMDVDDSWDWDAAVAHAARQKGTGCPPSSL